MSDVSISVEETSTEEQKDPIVQEAKPEANKPEAKPEPKSAVKSRTRTVDAQLTCPACRHSKSTALGKVEDREYRQCNRCHTAFVTGFTPIAPTKSGSTLSGLSDVADLQSELATLFASMKPGDSVTVADRLRVSEPFSEHWTANSIITAGGFAIAAEAVGFAPVDSSVQPVVLTKPLPEKQ